jgi:glycosyltransferase involved in cell wall biosynthesis
MGLDLDAHARGRITAFLDGRPPIPTHPVAASGASHLMADLLVIVAARDEADRIGATVAGLRDAFGDAAIWVADDGSTDGTSDAALATGAQVIARGRPHGKGGNVSAAAEAALGERPAPGLVLLCDGDLGDTAARLEPLAAAVAGGECDLAVGAFRVRAGGGFGVALGFARWAIRNRCGFEADAPISGQRAMRADVLRATVPFADGWGMEVGMTIDAVRAGFRVREIELDLAHRATARTPRGFLHRAVQLRDFARAWWARRGRSSSN